MEALISMGGMDMGTNVMFAEGNSALARGYWYIVAGILGFTFSIRIITYLQTSMRLRLARSRAFLYPTKPRNLCEQAYATATAIYRETVGPEIYFKIRGLEWLSPPSLGKSILIAIYWAVIAYMLTNNAIIHDAYYWERVAFRAAWISATQVPMVYLLAMKSSIIGVLSGSSHERLNWLHRWVSRTLLITTTIHGSFFIREWWLADFIDLEFKIMPMVRYGLGAWFLLVWTTLSSLTPIRKLSYELFVVQHLAAAGVFLWLLWVHIPAYAQYNVWFAIAAISVDKLFLWGLTVWENVSIKRLGHRAEIRMVEKNVAEVIIHNVNFSWKAGQHIYLRLPMLGPFEAHPFTIANVHHTTGSNHIQLIVQAKAGLTRRLMKKALRAGEESMYGTTVLVTGPFGSLPDWRSFETLVLISASTGASFTLPILESIVFDGNRSCVTRIDLLMITRNRKQISFYLPRLTFAQEAAASAGIILNVRIAITCPCDAAIQEQYNIDANYSTASDEYAICKCGNKIRSDILLLRNLPPTVQLSRSNIDIASAPTEKDIIFTEKDIVDAQELDNHSKYISEIQPKAIPKQVIITETSGSSIFFPSVIDHTISPSTSQSHATEYSIGSRPDIRDFIRHPVEATGGETAVVVCGGRGLAAETRTAVASLSDERAVHKGTGAQGIMCYEESYSF